VVLTDEAASRSDDWDARRDGHELSRAELAQSADRSTDDQHRKVDTALGHVSREAHHQAFLALRPRDGFGARSLLLIVPKQKRHADRASGLRLLRLTVEAEGIGRE
jgi:hypothetical protein